MIIAESRCFADRDDLDRSSRVPLSCGGARPGVGGTWPADRTWRISVVSRRAGILIRPSEAAHRS
jgi:hypothetical protein